MNRKFISKSNFVLRKILNKEENIDILKEFIEVILNLRTKEIKINPYLKKMKEYLPAEENFGIADFRIKTIENKERNIGIQIIDGEYVLTKMLLYYVQIHVNQIEYEDNRKIAKTMTINILDFILNKDLNYHAKMLMNEKIMNGKLRDSLEIHILQLPKFKLQQNQITTKKQAWISYLQGVNIESAIKKSEKIKKLDNLLEKYWREEIME